MKPARKPVKVTEPKANAPKAGRTVDALRQRPIAVALQQAWQIIGKSAANLRVKLQPLAKAIRQGSASEEEVLLCATAAPKSGTVVAWGGGESSA